MTTTESIRHDFLTGTLSRREIILDCTATIAMSGEYDAVQMRAIADRAGMAVGTLYRYIPSKPHVLIAVLAREFERLSALNEIGPSQRDRRACGCSS